MSCQDTTNDCIQLDVSFEEIQLSQIKCISPTNFYDPCRGDVGEYALGGCDSDFNVAVGDGYVGGGGVGIAVVGG